MKFAKEHPTEIIILKIKFDGMDTPEERKLWADTAWKLLGNRLLEAPDKGEPTPTYSSAVESNRNIIMATGLPNRPGKEHPAIKYYWNVGQNTDNWLGDGNELLWNEPTWQSGDIKKVIKSTEEYIEKNGDKIDKRDKFWAASVQLTPALGGSISTFISSGGSVRPKDLALGGGIGTHGSFKGSNKELRESGTLKKRPWKRHASLVMYDFADTDTAGDIVAMNLPPFALYDEKGGEDHEGGGRGGHGGRGGGEGRGRGGGRGGRGRGGHDD